MMRSLLSAIVLTLIFSGGGFAQMAGKIDRSAFYQAMQQDKKEPVNDQLKSLSKAPADVRLAFEGALTMKKAGLGGGPAQKLKLFKAGHKELEAAIKKEPGNVEFRFLRLLIQENAPGILGYKDNLTEDSEMIKRSYKTLPEEARQAIEDYSKKSKILKLQVS